jgi:phosphatidylserine/phosphatidylglycerophosphate/cardiolipin synthase-like enzyme
MQVLTYNPATGGQAHWPLLDNALRAAAVRGVKVELLVSDWNLEAPAVHHLRSLAALPHVEVRVTAIPEDPGGFIPYARVIHSKLLRVDRDTLMVSTSNGRERYFTASRNVEVLFRDAALAAQADLISDRLWNSPHTFRLEPGRTYTPRKRG